MDVEFDDDDLERLEADASFSAGFSAAIVSAFRKRMQQIRAAKDERDFFALRSLHFKQLQGKRQHQHSMRLNDQWRLILELRGKAPTKIIAIVSVEDYH